MNSATPRPAQLDSFETDLLARLRAEVARSPRRADTRSAVDSTGSTDHDRSRRNRRPLLAAASTAAVALAAAGTLMVTASTPAYAVDTDADGNVTASITRFEDAAGLQAALAKHGIRAQIDYLPPGKVCAPGQYRDADWRGQLAVGQGRLPGQDVAAMFVSVPLASWRPELTLVLGYSGDVIRSHGSAGVAQGPVAACQAVDIGQLGTPSPVPDVQPGQPPVSRAVAS